MSSSTTAYERLREQLEHVSRPERREDRRTLWVVDRLLGLAVTTNGTVEILLVGEQLHPASEVVRRHMRYARWSIEEASIQIEANRIALPAQPHFLSLAALIAVELTRCGLRGPGDLAEAFRLVEPLIELALRRTILAKEHIIGLMGELLCLEVMLDAIDTPELMSSVLDMWRGHTGARDFVLGDVGIEVKTTQSMQSSHRFSGLHQVEPGSGGNARERKVYLLSIGLVPAADEGQSLSELVERVLRRLRGSEQGSFTSRTPIQTRFLSEVASYGRADSLGYDHETMATEHVYNVRLRSTFTPRLYNLSDPSVRMLRREFLESTHVSTEDLQFRLELQDLITPSNPASNWAQSITHMVKAVFSR